MNKITTSLIAVSAMTYALHATNGDNLIGLGAKARGMGGVGIAMSHGAESALANPALISSVARTDISFGGTVLMPDVKTRYDGSVESSDSTLSIVPEIAVAHRATESFVMGVGMWGTAGMGVDYRDSGVNDKMSTTLQLMQFGVPLAYTSGGLSVGIAPVLQYGMLDLKYDTGAGAKGYGASQDFGIGYNLGAAYTMDNLSIGAMYKSPIEMKYSHQMSTMMQSYGVAGIRDTVKQPAEMGIGIAYKIGKDTVAFDYKNIRWAEAAGYDVFGWENQNVFALGYEHVRDSWALRAGYNYAKSPISEQSTATALGQAVNLLNLMGFPAIVESHYTVGGSYSMNKNASIDVAYVYAPKAQERFDVGSGASVSTEHTQSALSAQLNLIF